MSIEDQLKLLEENKNQYNHKEFSFLKISLGGNKYSQILQKLKAENDKLDNEISELLEIRKKIRNDIPLSIHEMRKIGIATDEETGL